MATTTTLKMKNSLRRPLEDFEEDALSNVMWNPQILNRAMGKQSPKIKKMRSR